MKQLAQAQINLNALRHNLGCVKAMAPRSSILAMVKSNAYGHGLIPVAQTLSDVDYFGVITLDEAQQLRQAAITTPIVLMAGFHDEDELKFIAEHRLSTVVHSQQQLDILTTTPLQRPISVWLKINTGMNRLGFMPKAFTAVQQRLQACAWVKKPVVLMSHFGRAGEKDQTQTLRQINRFDQLTSGVPGLRSLAGSAAILQYPDTCRDIVRPGKMLYGISPIPGKTGPDFGLQPVMTLRSRLIAIQLCEAGQTIGYGHHWICPETMPVGIVAIGYGDGYPSQTRHGFSVAIQGVECPVIGVASMNYVAVDLRGLPQAKCGDSVVLWGDGFSIEHLADKLTISPCALTVQVKNELLSTVEVKDEVMA